MYTATEGFPLGYNFAIISISNCLKAKPDIYFRFAKSELKLHKKPRNPNYAMDLSHLVSYGLSMLPASIGPQYRLKSFVDHSCKSW